MLNSKVGRSLSPTAGLNWYSRLQADFRLFNKIQRQENQPELTFKQYCYNVGIDLSGANKVDVSKMPPCPMVVKRLRIS